MLTFDDFEPITVPVKIGKRDYILRELDEGGNTKYTAAQLGATQFDGTKAIGLKGEIAETQALLVSLCLFELYGDPPKERPVLLSQIYKMAPSTVRELFKKCKEISKLDRNAEVDDAEKKSQGATQTTTA